MLPQIRGLVLPGVLVLAVAGAMLSAFVSLGWLLPTGFLLALLAIGLHDVVQTRHGLLREYPLLGHFLLEEEPPAPPAGEQETGAGGSLFYAEGYGWIAHSLVPKPVAERPAETLRVAVGEGRCPKPYAASVLNVGPLPAGTIGASAVRALAAGARAGGFALATGASGAAADPLTTGGDRIWRIGPGYEGCRTESGEFDADAFAERAKVEAVKMIEIALAPGGGRAGGHSAFDSPAALLDFVARLRERSGGKPVGVELSIGDPRQFFALCKAMVETDLLPDFVTVDGSEAANGAAPVDGREHLGAPLREGLILVHNALVGIGVRDRLRVATTSSRTSAFEIAAAIAMGADWCNATHGFLRAAGGPTNGAEPDARPAAARTRRLPAPGDEPAERVHRFHRETVESLARLTAAAGLDHPGELGPDHLWWRLSQTDVRPLSRVYELFEPGQLLTGRVSEGLRDSWEAADARRW